MDLDSVFSPALCLPGTTLICPTSAPTITEPSANCLFHIISGSLKIGKEPTKCELTEINTDEVYLQSIDSEEWVLSTPETIQIQPTCINLDNSITPTVSLPSIQVKGDVQVHIPRQCTITAGHHIVPTRLLMTQDIGKITNKMVIPTLHTHQLLNMHGTQLIDDKLDDELNTVFKDMVESYHRKSLTLNSTSAEVKELIKTMLKETHEAEEIQPNITYHTVTWSTLIILSIVFGVLIWWVRAKPLRVHKTLTHIYRHGTDSNITSTELVLDNRRRKKPDIEETTAL